MVAPWDGLSLKGGTMLSDTRSVVMDFMGLVPLSCPPSSAFFKPFVEDDCESNNNLGVDNVSSTTAATITTSKNNNNGYRKSLPIYYDYVNNYRKTSTSRCVKKTSSFRTVIKKHDKLVILEGDVDKSQAIKLSEVEDECKTKESDACLENLNQHAAILRPDRLRSRGVKKFRKIPTKSPLQINLAASQRHRIHDAVPLDGTSVDYSLSPSSKGVIFLSNANDRHYVDISKVNGLEEMVEKGELSPVVKPLFNELQGLRFNALDSNSENVMSHHGSPISPNSQVADALRALADQVQTVFEHELNGATRKIVNLEESKKLTFEVLREIIVELTKDIAPGWCRVVLPLLLSQTAALALLLLGNRSVVGKLVDYTSKFIYDDLDDLLESSGGWDGIGSYAFGEAPLFAAENQRDNRTQEVYKSD